MAAPIKYPAKILVGICSSHVHPERRRACRETWLTHAANEVACLFFVGVAPDAPAEWVTPARIRTLSYLNLNKRMIKLKAIPPPRKDATLFRSCGGSTRTNDSFSELWRENPVEKVFLDRFHGDYEILRPEQIDGTFRDQKDLRGIPATQAS